MHRNQNLGEERFDRDEAVVGFERGWRLNRLALAVFPHTTLRPLVMLRAVYIRLCALALALCRVLH